MEGTIGYYADVVKRQDFEPFLRASRCTRGQPSRGCMAVAICPEQAEFFAQFHGNRDHQGQVGCVAKIARPSAGVVVSARLAGTHWPLRRQFWPLLRRFPPATDNTK